MWDNKGSLFYSILPIATGFYKSPAAFLYLTERFRPKLHQTCGRSLNKELCILELVFYFAWNWQICLCVQQLSPFIDSCLWLTAKMKGREDRQCRVMRDVVNRLGHASVATGWLWWHVSPMPQCFVNMSPVRPEERPEVEKRHSLILADYFCFQHAPEWLLWGDVSVAKNKFVCFQQ